MECVVCQEPVEAGEQAFVVGEEALHWDCYDRVKEKVQEAPVSRAQFSQR
jgi:hypothetical protein